MKAKKDTFLKIEWNKLNEYEKKRFIKTFKPPLYLLIAIVLLYLLINFSILPSISTSLD